MFKKHLYNFAPTRTALFKLAFLGCLCFQEKKKKPKSETHLPKPSTEPKLQKYFFLNFHPTVNSQRTANAEYLKHRRTMKANPEE